MNLLLMAAIVVAAAAVSVLVQVALVAAVAAIATASLLLVVFLDNPYEGAAGSLEPVQMKRAIATMEEQQHVASAPYTRTGEPLT